MYAAQSQNYSDLTSKRDNISRKLDISRDDRPGDIKTRSGLRPGELEARRGFTVVEMIIALVTMFLVFTIGMANIRGFQRRRVLEGAVSKVKGDLRLAQEMAISGIKPPTCITNNLRLLSVRLVVVDTVTYRIDGVCSDGNNYNYDKANYSLEPDYGGIVFNGTPTVVFNTIGRGVLANTAINFNQTGTTNTGRITITTGGEIK